MLVVYPAVNYFLELTLILGGIAGTVYSMRSIRRLQKKVSKVAAKFKAHTTDTDAHKGDSNV